MVEQIVAVWYTHAVHGPRGVLKIDYKSRVNSFFSHSSAALAFPPSSPPPIFRSFYHFFSRKRKEKRATELERCVLFLQLAEDKKQSCSLMTTCLWQLYSKLFCCQGRRNRPGFSFFQSYPCGTHTVNVSPLIS